MNIPWDAVIIIAVGTPLGIWWYLAQVKILWNSVQTFKAVKKSMMMGQSPEEIKEVLGRLLGHSQQRSKEKKEKKEEDWKMYQ